MDTAHQAASLAVEIRVDLLLKCGLVEVSTADSNAESNGLFFSFASHVLEDGHGRVDTTAFAEECADCSSRSFGSNEDDVDVCWYVDFGQILEDRREAVREVESL